MFWVPILAFLGGMAVVKFWDEIVGWLKGLVSKLKDLLVGLAKGTLYAAAVVAVLVETAVSAIAHRFFYKENGEWYEKTTTRKIPESEVPPYIRKRLKRVGKEEDVTNEVEAEMGLTI